MNRPTPQVEECPAVALADAVANSPPSDPSGGPLQGPQRSDAPFTEMVNSGGPSAGLEDAKRALEDLILFSDAPVRARVPMA